MQRADEGRGISGNTDAGPTPPASCPRNNSKGFRGIGVCTYPVCESCTIQQPKEKHNDTKAKK